MKKIIKTSLMAFIFILVSANGFSTTPMARCGWSLRQHSNTINVCWSGLILPAGINWQPVSKPESVLQNTDQRPVGWSLRPHSTTINLCWSARILPADVNWQPVSNPDSVPQNTDPYPVERSLLPIANTIDVLWIGPY